MWFLSQKKMLICKYSTAYMSVVFPEYFYFSAFMYNISGEKCQSCLVWPSPFVKVWSCLLHLPWEKHASVCLCVDVSLFFTTFWNSNVKCLDIFHKRKKSNNKKPNNFGKSSWLECFWGKKIHRRLCFKREWWVMESMNCEVLLYQLYLG